jgi:two-component system chemotaxis response regulator CheB
VIALVTSEGGLEALVKILSGLPRDLPAVLIALQHQAPTHDSFLQRIIGRSCALPVKIARDGDSLDRSTVYVVPPGKHALVTEGPHVALIDSGPFPPYRPSADLLLTTMALTLGPCAIAVILTGRGHDGATGACAVHRFGGTVVATDEATSARFEMPSAAISRDDIVDIVVPLDEVAPLLCKLVDLP